MAELNIICAPVPCLHTTLHLITKSPPTSGLPHRTTLQHHAALSQDTRTVPSSMPENNHTCVTRTHWGAYANSLHPFHPLAIFAPTRGEVVASQAPHQHHHVLFEARGELELVRWQCMRRIWTYSSLGRGLTHEPSASQRNVVHIYTQSNTCSFVHPLTLVFSRRSIAIRCFTLFQAYKYLRIHTRIEAPAANAALSEFNKQRSAILRGSRPVFAYLSSRQEPCPSLFHPNTCILI
ncbi:hypothetical protein BD410DRAFT_503700 [Rickenella mellea]|uniref:Uncharacterized protein n=1 Tax=Rickenella mellea TaxID=50990 RepID=A0A4Y7PSL2_9AGAM|nr:hypothetical protein BD410DRAFT_503700 [Rickenella mellea]